MARATRRTFLQTAGGGALAAHMFGTKSSLVPTHALAEAQATQKPNILFMLVDNLGYGARCLRGRRDSRRPHSTH